LRAIILAAGKGSRLEPVSGDSVKCLVELGGMTLIERQVSYLQACGISQIAVVVGFQAERIRRICGPELEYVENPIFAETNSLYSLWLARHLFGSGFVVMNSDVFFHPQLLRDLVTSEYEDAILVSSRNQTKYGDEEMKVKIRGGQLLDISKTMDPDEADGENVGIVKFGAIGASEVAKQLEKLIADGAKKSWAPRAFLEFSKSRPLHAVSTRGFPWIEIDFPDDLQRAQDEILPQIPLNFSDSNFSQPEVR
jgi:L-glutamine-phosphate cytidylyltransferase